MSISLILCYFKVSQSQHTEVCCTSPPPGRVLVFVALSEADPPLSASPSISSAESDVRGRTKGCYYPVGAYRWPAGLTLAYFTAPVVHGGQKQHKQLQLLLLFLLQGKFTMNLNLQLFLVNSHGKISLPRSLTNIFSSHHV